jgi:hypothetical protein
MAPSRNSRTEPTWTEVKTRLNDFDRVGLVDLVGALYRANAANRDFLHARFGLGADPIGPYRQTICRWINPDWTQDHSVAKAKKAISDYRKAVGAPEGLAELTTLYCEQASLSCQSIWIEEPGFHDALVRMYYQAIREVHKLEPPAHGPFASRLRTVRDRCLPWASTGDSIDDLFINSGLPGSDDERGASAPQT